jgi:UDPglucose 6-dehydrogenase
MRVTVYGHTGTVGSQLYRWLKERTPLELAGISLDRRDGSYWQTPDWVFLCLPTPTGPDGQDQTALENVIELIASWAKVPHAVVIRSTVLPGTCERIAQEHPEWRVYHWPEFLTARSAWRDFCHPWAHVVGGDAAEWADTWRGLLPKAMQVVYVDRTTAELIKYAHNVHGALQVTFANLLYDMAQRTGADFGALKRAMPSLGYIGQPIANAYWDVWKDGGRGYGGACFPKDTDAIRHWLAGQAELLDGMAAANGRLRREGDGQARIGSGTRVDNRVVQGAG